MKTESVNMAGSSVAAISLVLFAFTISGVSPCSLTEDYSGQSVVDRIAEAKVVVYGSVTAHYPLPVPDGESENPWTVNQTYTAEMEIYCVFKGGPLPNRINITQVGDYTSCSQTHMLVGKEYITLIQKETPGGSQYVPDEVNMQTAAFTPTNANFYYVSEDSDVEVSSDACTNYSGDDPVPCFQTGTDHESCDGAGGLRASVVGCVLVLMTSAYLGWMG